MKAFRKATLMVTLLAFSFSFVPSVWAKKRLDYSALQAQYGKDLKAVPFYLRQKFLNDKGKAWPKASMQERAEFLNAYFAQKAREDLDKRKKQGMKVRKEKYQKKQKYSKQRSELREEQQKQRAKMMEYKREQMKKKQFARLVQMQKKKMQRARQR